MGFMEGRKIQENLRKTVDIISHIYQSGKKAVVVSIDFEKCFDRLEHKAIRGSLEYFGFGPKYTNAVMTFFNDFWLCTQNAGEVSEIFCKETGANQGCPISPFVYNLSGEIMAHLIRGNPEIRGVHYAGVSNVITQFADDTSLFLMYTESCINAAIETLMYVEKSTGLKVSYKKTTIYRVGSLKNSAATMYTIKPIKWSDGDIEMLGMCIRNMPTQDSSDFEQGFLKMSNVVNHWSQCNSTLMGKVLLVNTLMSSLFIYKMAVLPLMTNVQYAKIDEIVKNFLWRDKKPKIPIA